MLDREHRYAALCGDPSTTAPGGGADGTPHCEARAVRISLVYSVATFAFMSSNLPTGLIADSCGPRRTAVLCNAGAGLAALLVAVPPRWNAPFDTLLLGLPLLAFFGPGLEVAYSTVANLFPGSESTVIGTTSGMMGGSALMFPVYAVVARSFGPTLTGLFLGHACVAFAFAAAALLLPRRTVPQQPPASEEEGAGGRSTKVNPLFAPQRPPPRAPRTPTSSQPEPVAHKGNDRGVELAAATQSPTATDEPGPLASTAAGRTCRGQRRSVDVPPLLVGSSDGPADEDAPPPTPPASSKWVALCQVLLSRPMLSLMLWFAAHYARLAYYLGTAALQFARVADGDAAEAASLLTILSWVAPFGALASPVTGALADARGHRTALGVVHVLGLLHCAAMLSPWPATQVGGMAAYTIQQEGLFAVGQARVLSLVPAHQFGGVSGCFLVVGAAAR